jgi:hypothetical protein
MRKIIVCIDGLDEEYSATCYYLIQDIGQLTHCIYEYERHFCTQTISINVNPSSADEEEMKSNGYLNFQDLEQYPVEFEGYIR